MLKKIQINPIFFLGMMDKMADRKICSSAEIQIWHQLPLELYLEQQVQWNKVTKEFFER